MFTVAAVCRQTSGRANSECNKNCNFSSVTILQFIIIYLKKLIKILSQRAEGKNQSPFLKMNSMQRNGANVMLGMIKQAQEMNVRVESLSFNPACPSTPLYYVLKRDHFILSKKLSSHTKNTINGNSYTSFA